MTYAPMSDQPLVHRFIRRFGRRPTSEELVGFGAFRASGRHAARLSVRQRLARLILG